MNDALPQASTVTQDAPRRLPPIGELLNWSLAYYQKHYKFIIPIAAVPAFFGVLQAIVGELLSSYLGLAIMLVTSVSAFLARLALMGYVLRGDITSPEHAYRYGFKILIPFVWVSILTMLAVLGGMVIFIIPGILLSIWLSFSTYVLISEEFQGASALRRSWYYASGYWFPLFWRFLVISLILGLFSMLVVSMTAGGEATITVLEADEGTVPKLPIQTQIVSALFNYLIAVPLGIIYTSGIFEALRGRKPQVQTAEQEARYKRFTTAAIVVGALGIVLVIGLIGLMIGFFVQGMIVDPGFSAGLGGQLIRSIQLMGVGL